MLAHAIVSSVLKNETVVEDPEDVHGILELCQVLIREQTDAAPLPPGTARRGAFSGSEREDVAEEQGWIARMVHLFRSESLGTQFEVRIYLSP
jgi:vacuolar protein sorting-associated protein 35